MRRVALLALLATLAACDCGGTKPITEDSGTGGGAASGGGAGGGGGSSDAGGGGGAMDGGTDCGDGVREGAEACDDGSTAPNDGCSPTCTVEMGWFCPFPPPNQPSMCVPSCGDGRLIGNEPCDDGNARNGDGCSNTCAIEPGYSCTGIPSVCSVGCGDGVKAATELCDDANRINGDGCSSTCMPEQGFVCAGTMPSMCRPLCGDGMMVMGEACDDGFQDACGSCNSNCTGPGAGSSCGDGVRCPQTEACDEGVNPGPQSMCTPQCTIVGSDAGVPDAGVPDAGFDSGVPDAGFDAGFDAGVPDAGFDAGVPDAGGGIDAGPPGMGVLTYQKIPNITFGDDFTRVAWHPSGRFALILGTLGRVIKYDPTTKTLSLVQQIASNASLADIDAAKSGTFFLIVGVQASVSHLWRIDVGAMDALAPASDLGTFTGTASAIAVEPNGSDRFAFVSRGATNINYLFVWTSGAPPAPRGYNASAGAMSLMWGNAAAYAPSMHILTSDGVNGADSRTWLEQSNMFVTNGWSPGFGNPGQGHWQPNNGTFGAFVGWSSNKLYAFDGTWHLVNLPGNNGISPQQFSFRADGQRGLIVGRPVGTTLRATVIEYRPTSVGAYDDGSFVDVGIDNFALTPYFGNSNQYLLDVAWRPGACDEGLIVGMDNTSQPFGLAIRFYDTSQTVCVP